MGKLIRLELYNFKSYKGHHTLLFGDSYFTSIIGPNGSGKSNSMDAISFVLGIKSSHLRSTHLKDLVYRGRVLKTSKINDDGSAVDLATNGHTNGHVNGDDNDKPNRGDPKSAWVMAVYEDDGGDEQRWKRTITNQGSSEYRINERVVTAQQYNEALESENILIKARNFLVFQGDIEAIASQSPQDLTRLIEQISGSLEYKADCTEKANAAKAEVQKRSKDIESRQKAISALEAEVQRNSASKFALLRRCRLEQLNIPLSSGSLDNLPNEDNLLHQDPDAMDLDDGDDADMIDNAMDDYGIEIDFDQLDDDLKNPDDENVEEALQEKISSLTAELEKLNPNMRAMERLESVEARLQATAKEFEDAKDALESTKMAFNEIKEKRNELYKKAFDHIQEQISTVYKELTRSEQYPIGGQAYLDIEEDTDKPYISGVKYHAMPPLKRFRDMEHLSGGEKTIAALALLFAIHSYQPSPFFVLDEVDAALDNANVEKIKNYIAKHAGPGMQFIVISLKTNLFQDSESLIGVYRDQEVNSSRTLTLDLRKYI
ncbi:hypothetical protein M426DRAFT_142171 [Hypoxylon sp. CI-4A]|nr:hypothetical protein M426DRAFT_142171 [Hypoxylon sp. CI-4A]